MRAGQLRHRITIQSETETLADSGQPTRTWTSWKKDVPARVENVSGGEVVRGRQVATETTTLITIRYIEGLTTQHRISYGTRTLGIVRINDVLDMHREMRVECKESDA